MDADNLKALIVEAIEEYGATSDRSIQSAEGILGPSDIGFCRQKAVLMTKGVKATDNPPMWAASVGIAIHNYTESAIKKKHPDWIVGSIDQLHVVATLPSGAAIGGHPDLVIPSMNILLDIKTVDGFQWVKREGTSIQHRYQRHLYALGLIQSGILTRDNLRVGNIYFDRSGKIHEPLLYLEDMDDSLTGEVDSWVQDVIYAVTHGEDSNRDIPAAVCERICSHFTACRGSLETHDSDGLIEDPTLVSAIDMYVEGRDLEKIGGQMKTEASAILHGINGTTGKHQIRWVTVESPGKTGYSRLDVREVRTTIPSE
jgi:hypothetical protein